MYFTLLLLLGQQLFVIFIHRWLLVFNAKPISFASVLAFGCRPVYGRWHPSVWSGVLVSPTDLEAGNRYSTRPFIQSGRNKGIRVPPDKEVTTQYTKQSGRAGGAVPRRGSR